MALFPTSNSKSANPLTNSQVAIGEDLLPREEVRKALINHKTGRPINRSTLWRWCVELNLPRRTSFFTQEEFNKLLQLQSYYQRGGLTKSLEVYQKTEEQAEVKYA